MVFKSKQQQQKPKALPHLSSKGLAIPDVQVQSKHHEIAMPGQKPLPNADWKEQQLVPSAQGNRGGGANNRRLSVQRQGLPWTERGNFENHPEPPPMFSATPSKKATIKHVRESNAQKQVYRMDGGLDPVTLLTGRLESWRLAIKSIVSLFKKISAVELKTSKGFIEASKEVVVPFEKGQGQFLELGTGGVQDVWASLRDYTTQHGILQHESAGYIEKAVIPTLRAIKTDIKTMIVSIQKDRDLKSDDIFESRLKIDKLISRLDKTIEFCNRAPQQADQNPDPFLINLQIIHAIRELCDSENQLHDHLLNLQKEVGYFEHKIIENVRYVLQKWEEFRLKNKMDHKDFIGKVIETFNHIKPSLEWNEFIRRNQYNLILENSAYKTEDMVQYPNQFSNYVRAVKIGPLKAKTGALKGFSQSIHILTPAGFLHGYKSPKYFQEHPLDPSYTIFVPDCDIEYDDDGSFQLRSNTRRMGMGTNSVFRPSNPKDGQEWIDELVKISDQYRVTPLFESSYYSSAPTTRHLPALPDSIMPSTQNTPQAIEQPQSAPAIENGDFRGESDLDPILEGEPSHEQPNVPVHHEEEEEEEEDLESEQLPHPAAAIAKSVSRREEKQPYRQDRDTTYTSNLNQVDSNSHLDHQAGSSQPSDAVESYDQRGTTGVIDSYEHVGPSGTNHTTGPYDQTGPSQTSNVVDQAATQPSDAVNVYDQRGPSETAGIVDSNTQTGHGDASLDQSNNQLDDQVVPAQEEHIESNKYQEPEPGAANEAAYGGLGTTTTI